MPAPPPLAGPYGPGVLPVWQQNLDNLLQTIKTRLNALEQDLATNAISAVERNERIAELHGNVEQLMEDVRDVATTRREWEPKLRIALITRLSTGPQDFISRTRRVVGTMQTWLIQFGYIFTSQELGEDDAAVLLSMIDDGVSDDYLDAVEKPVDPKAVAEDVALVAIDDGIDELEDDEDDEGEDDDETEDADHEDEDGGEDDGGSDPDE